jgi:hypothetical protein
MPNQQKAKAPSELIWMFGTHSGFDVLNHNMILDIENIFYYFKTSVIFKLVLALLEKLLVGPKIILLKRNKMWNCSRP